MDMSESERYIYTYLLWHTSGILLYFGHRLLICKELAIVIYFFFLKNKVFSSCPSNVMVVEWMASIVITRASTTYHYRVHLTPPPLFFFSSEKDLEFKF